MIQAILSIAFFLAAISLFVISSEKKYNGEKFYVPIFGALLFTALFIVSCTFSVVPAGKTGILITMGKMSDATRESGVHFKIPFAQKIVVIDNRIQRTDVDGSGASKDLQNVATSVSVNYRVQASESASLYKEVGLDWDTIIVRPAVQECMKAVQSQYTAEELITKRSEVGQAIQESIAEKIGKYGLIVDNINILNMDFSDEFNAAIEAKQTAQQEALKAEQDLERIKVEAEQQLVAAQAEADANRIRSESITDKIILSDFIQKWNGSLPIVVGNDGNILDISSLINQ